MTKSEKKHIVFLAGFMGSGKSTLGPQLAERLDYDFADIDSIVEKAEGISIAEIFEEHGEGYFRKVESRALKEIAAAGRNFVVALGGGSLTSEQNRAMIRESGVLVYLKAGPEEIMERVRAKRDRPMLLSPDGKTLSENELSIRVKSLLNEREKHYLEALITIDTSNSSIAKSVDIIESKLRGKIR